MADIKQITLPSGTTYDIKDETARKMVVYYGECSTAVKTKAKTATVDSSFTLTSGATVAIKFTSTDASGSDSVNPTLNINNTGAKQIIGKFGFNPSIHDAETSTGSNESPKLGYNAIYTFIYDGTNWNIINYDAEYIKRIQGSGSGSLEVASITVREPDGTDTSYTVPTSSAFMTALLGLRSTTVKNVLVNGTSVCVTKGDGDSTWLEAEITMPTKTSDLTNDSNFVSDASYVHTDNNYTTTEKNKLSGIASGAEVNQNAFSNVKVGTTTVAADAKTDTLELVGGTNITLTPDATNDKVTIALSTSPALSGTPTAPTASTGTDTTQIATTAFVQDAIAAVQVGASVFKGTVNSNTDISGLTGYKQGWYWVVATKGTYVGEECEVGDFIFCVANRGSAYSANDFKVVQANIDLSIFGDLAYKDTASTKYTPAGTVSQPTFSGTQGSVSVTTTDAVTAVTVNTTASGGTAITPAGTISKGTGTANYTPEGTVSQPTFSGTTGNVSVTTSGAVTDVSGSVNTTASGGVDIKPAGTVSTPTITVTPATGTVNSITDVGTLPALTTTVSNENLTIGWAAGTLPTKGDNTTVVTGITSATSTQPTFSGTQKYLHLNTTKDTVTSTGSFTPSGTVTQPTFSGTGAELKFTGTAKYIHTTKGTTTATGNFTPSGTVTQPTFDGTEATITVS